MPSLGHITRCRGEVREVLLLILYALRFILSSVLICHILKCFVLTRAFMSEHLLNFCGGTFEIQKYTPRHHGGTRGRFDHDLISQFAIAARRGRQITAT